MKPGTIVKLPDGRIGTVVYHGLDGHGIRFGRILDDVMVAIMTAPPGSTVGVIRAQFAPEAMLRDPAFKHLYPDMECAGDDYEVVAP